MQTATVLGLAGSLICVVTFAWMRRWLFAAGYLCSVTYIVLDKVYRPAFVPPRAGEMFSLLFFACVVAECYRIWREKAARKLASVEPH
jgi:uncharacterized membrane protein (DUF106 family)